MQYREDMKEMVEMFDFIAGKAPEVIKNLIKAAYSEETATEMGKAVGAFYKQLIEAGFKPEDALSMSRDYINNFQSFLDKLNSGT